MKTFFSASGPYVYYLGQPLLVEASTSAALARANDLQQKLEREFPPPCPSLPPAVDHRGWLAERTNKDAPIVAGQPRRHCFGWNEKEDQDLLHFVGKGDLLPSLAFSHQRSEGAIRSRVTLLLRERGLLGNGH